MKHCVKQSNAFSTFRTLPVLSVLCVDFNSKILKVYNVHLQMMFLLDIFVLYNFWPYSY